MNCSICLENLNDVNKTSFCCSTLHKKCILQCLKITGKCPLCRKKFSYIQNKLNEEENEYNNLDQVRYDIIEENNQALSNFGNCLEMRVIDFESRIIMLENNLSRRKEIINNKLLNSHSIRISFLEKSINNMETELQKIKRIILRK